MWTFETQYLSAERKATTGNCIIYGQGGEYIATVPAEVASVIVEAPAMVEALRDNLNQFEQMESMFRDDVEFIAALKATRAILSRIDGAGDTLPDAPVPAPTGEAKPHLFTVIWGNIGDDNGKRLDHVSVESADQNLIMDAAFECFFKDLERSGQTLTAEDREEFRHNTAYDGYAVLPGHVTDAPGMGFF